MRNFKKRTIALVLASVVTVAGSFASERFKNSLMELSFETSKDGNTSMIVQTKTSYSGSLIPIKRDGNTYILTLPEIDSNADVPDLTKTPQIQSVNIRTMPYTNNGKGYTRITIKTNDLSTLPVEQRIYLPSKEQSNTLQQKNEHKKNEQDEFQRKKIEKQRQLEENLRQERLKREEMQQEIQRMQNSQKKEQQNFQNIAPYAQTTDKNIKEEDVSSTINEKEKSNETYLLILGFLLIIFFSCYCYIKAKDKMVELSGEKLDIDIKEDTNKQSKKSKKINKIKNAIKMLDSAYTKTAVPQTPSKITQDKKIEAEPEVVQDVQVVDLDALFQKQLQDQKSEQTADEVENQALEDFLNSFSFDEEFDLEEKVEELYDVELFEQIINSNFDFSKKDIECINKLMRTEINDETYKNIDNYLVSNPVQKTKDKILEDLLLTYAISQNINFNEQEIETLYKLINLEIKSDFITDLRTNPKRTIEVQEEIIKSSKSKTHKPSEIITLKVSKALPDLSEALKQQGNKNFNSNRKPETVYFSEGYNVSTLSISNDLPDLSKEINNKKAYAHRPTEDIELVDNSYEVKTLSISNDLPDLSKILQEPENDNAISNKQNENVVDEKALLENISNVSFKPFDDSSQNFEVLNDFEDFYAIDNSDPNDVLSFEEIAAEFEELYSEKITNNTKNDTEIASEQISDNKEIDKNSVSIIKDFEQKEDVEKSDITKEKQINKNETFKENSETKTKICIIENESYDILSTTNFTNDSGCYLTKNSKGYSVIGFINNKLFNLKTYSTLKSEKIQSRMSEKLDNGTKRYIVRIGINKFILDVDNENIKFVIDLC